jgi:predicted component of type VI protein secretion system
MKRKVIDVDAKGRDAAGNAFDWVASQEAVSQGYMVNVPVRLRFPDGLTLDTTQAMVTPKGLKFFAKELGDRKLV